MSAPQPATELGFGQQLNATVKAGGTALIVTFARARNLRVIEGDEALKQWIGTKVWYGASAGGEYKPGSIKSADPAAKRIIVTDVFSFYLFLLITKTELH